MLISHTVLISFIMFIHIQLSGRYYSFNHESKPRDHILNYKRSYSKSTGYSYMTMLDLKSIEDSKLDIQRLRGSNDFITCPTCSCCAALTYPVSILNSQVADMQARRQPFVYRVSGKYLLNNIFTYCILSLSIIAVSYNISWLVPKAVSNLCEPS